MIFETHATVEIDGAISVIDLQVHDCDAELPGLIDEKFERLLSDSSSPIGRAHKELSTHALRPRYSRL